MMINSIRLTLTPTKLLSLLVFAVACCSSAIAQSEWTPKLLADGQPDIGGMWNNVGATAHHWNCRNNFKDASRARKKLPT